MANSAVVRFNSATTTNNRFVQCEIAKGAGGSYADNINGALNNFMFNVIDKSNNLPLYAYVLINNSDANYDLAATVYGIIIPKMVRFNGATTLSRDVTMPDTFEHLVVWNNTGNNLNLKPAGGSGELVGHTERKNYFFDGTNGKIY